MSPLKWGGSMNEYQEKYVALKSSLNNQRAILSV